MKKQTLIGIFFIAALAAFSMVFTPAVFAEDITHTITITNNSNTELIPTNNPHIVGYAMSTACANVPPDTCGQKNMTPPSKIAPNGGTAVLNMTGPKGCKVSMWQTYYQPGKGKQGSIRCTMSGLSSCNSVSKNYTCTISQANVDAVKGKDSNTFVNATAQ